MSIGGTEAIRFRLHSSLLLLQAGTTDETSGGIHRVEDMGPPYANVGLDYGPYRSGKGEGEVR